MKKLFTLLLAAALICAFAACGSTPAPQEPEATPSSVPVEEEPVSEVSSEAENREALLPYLGVWVADSGQVLEIHEDGTCQSGTQTLEYAIEDGICQLSGGEISAEVDPSGETMLYNHWTAGYDRTYYKTDSASIESYASENLDVSGLCGTWKIGPDTNGSRFSAIEIFEDGTCTLDGEAATWIKGLEGSGYFSGISILHEDGSVSILTGVLGSGSLRYGSVEDDGLKYPFPEVRFTKENDSEV